MFTHFKLRLHDWLKVQDGENSKRLKHRQDRLVRCELSEVTDYNFYYLWGCKWEHRRNLRLKRVVKSIEEYMDMERRGKGIVEFGWEDEKQA